MKRKHDIDDDELENVDLSEHIKNARWIEKKHQEEKKLISIVIKGDMK